MLVHYLDTLQKTMKENWDSPALSNFRETPFTYGDVAEELSKIHILYDKLGMEKGDKVALCSKNSARWAISFFTAVTDEKVIVPILADFHPDSVKSLVNHSDSKVLFTDKDIWNKIDATEGLDNLQVVINTNDYTLLYAKNEEVKTNFEQIDTFFAEKYPNDFSKEDVKYNTDNLEELSIINYTSGTTSASKGVMLPYRCVSATVDFAQRYIPTKVGNTMVSILPMAHIYGLVFEFIYPFCNGTTVYFLNKKPSPSLLLAAMGEIKPYLVLAVPLVMEKIFNGKIKPVLEKPVMKVLTKIPLVRQIIFSKIRNGLLDAFGGNVGMFILGGAAFNPDVETWLKRIKFPYTVGYGMTEAAPLIAYEPYKTFAKGSCGRAIDYLKVRIDSEDPQNIVGEIQAKGTNICTGYYKNEEATANLFTDDGYLKTGDLGIIDEKGNIFIKGRSKSMILSANGQNIYPEEIEAVINSLDHVIESVVVDRESKLVALVYVDKEALKKDGMNDEQIEDIAKNVMSISNKSLPLYSKITKVELVDEPFEKTPKFSIKRFLYQ